MPWSEWSTTRSPGAPSPRPGGAAPTWTGVGSRCGTGFGYAPDRRARQGAILAGLLPRVRDIRRLGSAALDLCAVAGGTLDAYYEEGIQRWDVAAGALIAQEAGAVISQVTHTDAAAGVLAAGPALQPQLSAALTEVAAEIAARRAASSY